MDTREASVRNAAIAALALVLLLPACSNEKAPEPADAAPGPNAAALELSDADVDNIVQRSFQYVAMYNVNNKFADKLGGWNICHADTQLKDHTMREIARPNNDSLYTSCALDLRTEPMILDMPDFDSEYVSLMITGYDHYVNIPMATRLGDFDEPETMLIYSARTPGYDGTPVEGVDRIFEATGDFVGAVLRIMPHSGDPERYQRIVEQIGKTRLVTLSEYLGGQPKPVEPVAFPPFGETDVAIFRDNLLEVMQFVFNHTTFVAGDPEDEGVLAAYAPLGISPGRAYDPAEVASIDGERFANVAERFQGEWLASLTDPATFMRLTPKVFQPKGETTLEALVATSIIGPIGLPREEAVYPQVATADGAQMNAMHDYVIHMSADELPPARAFWSLTLYDLKNGFFIPNDRKKYSVGLNAGMQLNEDGGIDIYIAAEQPEGVPPENWLPIERGDLDLSPQLRVYVPDLEAMKNWQPPVAEVIGEG